MRSKDFKSPYSLYHQVFRLFPNRWWMQLLFMFLCYSTVSLLKHFLTSSSNPVILSDPSLTLAIWSFFFFFFFLESNEFSNFLNLLLLLENRNVLKLFAHGCPRTNCRNNTGHRCAVCLLWARLGLVAQNSITLLYYCSTIQQIRPEECLPIYRQKKLLQDNCSCCCAESTP